MTLKSFAIMAICAAGLGIVSAPATAQGKIEDIPANFPPASFKGKQFVDNRGCVYVKAGFDGAVTWVPRVTRARKHVCGQTPSFGGQTAVAPLNKPASKPVQITNDAPPAAKPVAKTAAPQIAKPAKRAPKPSQPTVRVSKPKPKPQPAAKPVKRVVRAPASKPVAAPPPRVLRRVPETAAPAPRNTARVAPGGAQLQPIPDYSRGPCGNGSTKRAPNGQTVSIRCGSQDTPHVTVIRRGEAPGPGKNVYINKSYDGSSLLNLPGNTRIVPRHVYENGNHEILPIPQGYMPAWQDDRLNPYRAWQTVDGYRATQQVWTNTVPRQLAAKVRNHGLKDARVAYRTSHQAATRLQAEQARTPRISTRGAAVQTRSARFVEVGLFSTSAKAAEAAARLRAAGLPVRQQGARHAGEAMTRVSVGPYASVAALTAGLGAVRATGYTSAYTR
jgi:hypothetical protein